MLEGTNVEARQARTHDFSRASALDMPSDFEALFLHKICACEANSDGPSS